MRPKAYVGITGFKDDYEVMQVGQQYLENGFLGIDSGLALENHVPMFGLLCSSKKLADKSRKGGKSPRAQDLGRLAGYVPRGAISMIHYCTQNRRNLAEELKEVFAIDDMYENNYCRAVQLNQRWPDVDQVQKIREEFPDMQIVLQLPKKALPDAERAAEYSELAQYCLIDPSGGLGLEIAEQHLDLAAMLHETMPNTRIGVAGGFSGENVIAAIEKVYKSLGEPFCVDAEGRLRTEDKRALDFEETGRYIGSSAYAIRKGEKSS